MNILVLQETDWLIRGPNTQHHIFERLSTNPLINVYVYVLGRRSLTHLSL